MNTSSLPEALTRLISPLAESLGVSLWGLELAFGGKSMVRVYAEGPEGITIDQCAELSRLIGLTLDVEDRIPGAYVLEVSSPGLERVFFRADQLPPYVGRVLEATLFEPAAAYPGRRKFTGEFSALEGDRITLVPFDAPPGADSAPPVVFMWGDARKIRLLEFVPAPEAPAKGKKNRPQKPQTRALQPRRGPETSQSPSE